MVNNISIRAQSKANLIEQVKESVVWIHAFNMPYSIDEASYILGTGYVASDDGLIITNHHVIKNVNGLIVYAQNKKDPYYANILWSDSTLDLAVLQAYNCNIKALEFADPSSVKQGDETLIFGYPGSSYKSESLKVTWGIISSSPEDSTLQTTAAINSGNSGGPAINMQGKVIGTVYAKIVGLSIEGTGFIRNVKYALSAISKVKSTYLENKKYFGTNNFDAYKKICDAAVLGWKASNTDDFSVKESLNNQAKELILDALDTDPNFVEAYYFLTAYYYLQTLNYCLKDRDSDAKSAFSNFKQAYATAELKAKEYKPSLQYRNPSLNVLGKQSQNKDFNCSVLREYYNTLIDSYVNKEKRRIELEEYLNSGESPLLLKKAIEGSSGYSSSNSYSSNSRGNDGYSKSTFWKIESFEKDRPVRLCFLYSLPFNGYSYNYGFSLGNAGSTSSSYVYFKNQLSFEVIQDLGNGDPDYEYRRYITASYNLGVQAKFFRSARFSPKPYITVGYNPTYYQSKSDFYGEYKKWFWTAGAFNFGLDVDIWITNGFGLSLTYEYSLFFDQVFPTLYGDNNKTNLKYSTIKIGMIF